MEMWDEFIELFEQSTSTHPNTIITFNPNTFNLFLCFEFISGPNIALLYLFYHITHDSNITLEELQALSELIAIIIINTN